LEAGTEYGEEIEIEVEEGPQVQNHWTDDAGLTPVDEERQRTRRVATQADAQGASHCISCTRPDTFVVTLADTAKTSKAAQLGKPQDTVPIGSGDDVSVVFPNPPWFSLDALASRPPSIPPSSTSRAWPRNPFVTDD